MRIDDRLQCFSGVVTIVVNTNPGSAIVIGTIVGEKELRHHECEHGPVPVTITNHEINVEEEEEFLLVRLEAPLPTGTPPAFTVGSIIAINVDYIIAIGPVGVV